MSINPKISIITPCLNSEKHLKETIQSILNQTYKNLEYIIIDGGSTDNTINIIKKYQDRIKWISEKDKGISDAFNKGVKMATGDYINFQGDGDGFCEKDSLEKIFQNIKLSQNILISARIKRIDEEGKELFISKYIKKFNKRSLLFKMSLPHQGLFTHRKYFEKYGLFDVNNIFSMDYELLLRSYHDFPKVLTKNIVVANWREDGIGDKTIDVLKEHYKIKIKNKVAPFWVLILIHYWIMLKKNHFEIFIKIKNKIKNI